MNFSKRILCFILACVLLVSTMSISVFAKGDIMYGIAFVNGSGLRLRSSASTSSRVLDSASKGEVVVVVSRDGDWCKVIYDLQEGYMHADYLKIATRENAELGYGRINGSRVNLRSGPGTSYNTVAKGNSGDKAYIIGINEGWYKVIFSGEVCYIRSDYLDLTEAPYENQSSPNVPKFFRGGKSTGAVVSAAALGSGSTGSSSSSSSSSGSTVSSSSTPAASASQIVSTAEKYLGVPYVWGGSSPKGFDCSGFVYYVLKSLGYKASRTMSGQYNMGTPVDKSQLQPGDLVFFQGTYKSGMSHVGIYVGNGQFIHSPHTGKVVCYSDLNSTYYTSHYYGACRVA